jgi:hypothetical protein
LPIRTDATNEQLERGLVVGHGRVVMLGAQAAEAMREAGAFTGSEQWRFGWERIYTRDEWLDQVPTQGDHRQFPPAMLAELPAGTGATINEVGAASRCATPPWWSLRRERGAEARVDSGATPCHHDGK